jgi:hypothetical protein
MKKTLLILFLMCSPLIAQDAKVDSLMVKPLPDVPGKDVQVLAVEYLQAAMTPCTGTTRTGLSTCWKALSSWP